jgi:hypothetical protein
MRRPGQNVEDFFCQIYEKGKLLNKPEHEMLSKFISGLPEQMPFFIRAGLPQDMETDCRKNGRSLWIQKARGLY